MPDWDTITFFPEFVELPWPMVSLHDDFVQFPDYVQQHSSGTAIGSKRNGPIFSK